ncbi:MAG: glycoside hydrolase family 127 protein, partial [Bacteroidota bacterium]
NHASHQDMEAERSGWFTCSCCPTNITRLIPSVPGYMYATKGDVLYINLFAQGTASVSLNKNQVQVLQENNYPWNGDLIFKIDPKVAQDFRLMIRIPGWARNEIVPSDLYTVKEKSDNPVEVIVNGRKIEYKVENGYAALSRKWKRGDVVQVKLPMEIQQIVSHEKVQNNIGKIALQRGPLVYCAEWTDNQGLVSNLILPEKSSFSSEFSRDLLNGVVIIKSEAIAVAVDSVNNKITSQEQPFIAIPYYAWAHRGKGEMSVWIPQQVKAIELITK